MTKPQFQAKIKKLSQNKPLGELYKEIAKATGYSLRTVERAVGNGKIDASRRFYETFKREYEN